MPNEEVIDLPQIVDTPEAEQSDKTAAASETAQPETQKKPVNPYLRQINKLTAIRYQNEGELKALRDQIAALKTPPAQAETKVADEDPEPKQDDFTTYELWIKAQARWEGRQVAREEYQKLSAKQEKEYEAAESEERDRQAVETYQGNVKSFTAEHDDFDEVVANIQMTKSVGEAVQLAIMEDPNGPLIAYHLGQHPELCKQFNDLSPVAAVAKLGRLAERLAPETAEDEDKEPSPTPKPEASAPAKPITPVKRSAPTATGLSDDLSEQEWLKRRNAQIKAQAGRT